MERYESSVHTFVVKVWLEPSELAESQGEWRGEVRHVLSGETRYFRTLQNVAPSMQELLDSPV